MVTGAAAAIIYGIPRMTNDLDLVLSLKTPDIVKLIQVFPEKEFYIPPVEVLEVECKRRQRGHFNIIHHKTGFKADMYMVGQDELHLWAMQHRQNYEIEDEPVWVAPVEYVIIRKLEYYREGGSSKHLQDIENIIDVSPDKIDRLLLSEKIKKYGLEKEWELVKKD
jgi:hypothetical protein